VAVPAIQADFKAVRLSTSLEGFGSAAKAEDLGNDWNRGAKPETGATATQDETNNHNKDVFILVIINVIQPPAVVK
jgi:hypothetical protein